MDFVFGHHEISFPQRGQTEVVILFKVEAEANSIEGQSGQIEQFREIQSFSFLWKEIKISIWVSTKLAKTFNQLLCIFTFVFENNKIKEMSV